MPASRTENLVVATNGLGGVPRQRPPNPYISTCLTMAARTCRDHPMRFTYRRKATRLAYQTGLLLVLAVGGLGRVFRGIHSKLFIAVFLTTVSRTGRHPARRYTYLVLYQPPVPLAYQTQQPPDFAVGGSEDA